MSKFTLTIQTDNAAFDGEQRNAEIARILREAADSVEAHPADYFAFPVRDINGNRVGDASLMGGK